MAKVAPSMLSADFSKFGDETERVTKAGASLIHLDVMDGEFVPNITFGPGIIKSIRDRADLPFDTHLMIDEPIRYIEEFAEAGSDYITFHVEATKKIQETIDEIHEYGKKAGISVKPGTPVSTIEPYLKDLELVLVMTVEPGFGGQKFMSQHVSKIKELDQYRKKNSLHYLISVDGGINRETGKQCADAGADILVAGNHLFKSQDMAAEIKLFNDF